VTAGVRIGGSFTFLRRHPSLPAHLVERHSFAAELLALSQETFARVAFAQEWLVFVTQLIPEVVKVGIMRSMYDMWELMQQGVRDLLDGQELPRVVVIPQPD
jgi:hypothetical protein